MFNERKGKRKGKQEKVDIHDILNRYKISSWSKKYNFVYQMR